MPRWPERNAEATLDQRERSTVDDRAEMRRAENRLRRAAAGHTDASLVRFHMTGSQIDPSRYVYRAVQDVDMRLHSFQQQDYEFVSRDDPSIGDDMDTPLDAENRVRYQHGSSDGKPLYTYLMRKRKDWADEDRQRDQSEKVDFLEAGRGLSKRGTKQSKAAVPSDLGEDAYVPNR